MMSWMYFLRDAFFPVDKRLEDFGIEEGSTVIDYGCGPGSYLRKAAALVGEKGKVYAVDIHPLAIVAIERKIKKFRLNNVEPVLAQGYISGIDSNTADLIFAIDMFHNVSDPTAFLKELRRIIKQTGVLILEDGHQPRAEAKEKLINSKAWNIVEETKEHQRCTPR
jgi:ubiquinone/menaquinone biosynthesis C-methylase UbiE